MTESADVVKQSRVAARLRVRAAMQHVEAAQRELSLACSDLSAVVGFGDQYTAVGKLRDRVHAMWYRLESRWKISETAPLTGRWPLATLDSVNAPGVVPPDEHPHRGCGDQVGGVRFHGLLHSTAAVGLLIAIACTGCTFDQRGAAAGYVDAAADAPPAPCDACTDAAPDGDAGDGGGIDAADGGRAGLPVNAPCEPLLDQCMVGLTCRIRAAHDGLCRPVGAVAPGGVCTSVDQCGENGACVPAEAGLMRCRVVCAVAMPALRCAADETCALFWTPDTGACI